MEDRKKYSLIQYTDGSFELLPSNWLTESHDGTLAVYPKNVGKLSQHRWTRMRQEAGPPQEDWLTRKCQVIAQHGESVISMK